MQKTNSYVNGILVLGNLIIKDCYIEKVLFLKCISRPMLIIKSIHLLIAFLLELAMLFGLGYYGFHTNMGKMTEFILGIGLPVVAILLWGFLAAPKAKHRLPFPYLIPFKLILFLLSAFLLYKSGQQKWALIFASIAIASELLEIIFNDRPAAEKMKS